MSKQNKFNRANKRLNGVTASMASLAALAIMHTGYKKIAHSDADAEKKTEWQYPRVNPDEIRPGTFGAYKQPFKPLLSFEMINLIAHEGARVKRDSTGNIMHYAYDDKNGAFLARGAGARGTATIGFGSTILADGSRVTSETAPITTKNAFDLAVKHLEDIETLFFLYAYETQIDSFRIETPGQALGLMSLMYNMGSKVIESGNDENHKKRNAVLRAMLHMYGDNVTDEMIKRAFEKYPVRKLTDIGQTWVDGRGMVAVGNNVGTLLADGAGMWTRRMVEYALLNDEIDVVELLDLPLNHMGTFLNVAAGTGPKRNKSVFWLGDQDNRRINPKIINTFRKWLKNPVDAKGRPVAHEYGLTIRDVLPPEMVNQVSKGKCKFGKGVRGTPKTKTVFPDYSTLDGFNDEYDVAITHFRDSDYTAAADRFAKMIKQYPDAALLYNDLGATYNKLGRYDDAIAVSKTVVCDVCNVAAFGAAQFNAGQAYEKQGKKFLARDAYLLAVFYGNNNAQQHYDRVSAELESERQAKIQETNKTKKFNDGKNKVNAKKPDAQKKRTKQNKTRGR